MAGVSHVNHFPCNNLSVTTPQPRFSSKPSLFPVNLIGFQAGKISERSKVLIGKFAKSKPVLIVRAVTEDEWGEGEWDEDEWGEDSLEAAVAVEKAPSKELTETEKLKKQLVDSFCGTDRGLTATSETRAEIVELITQLESKNPTPAPTEALTLLNGKWILAYTSFAGLFPLLTRVVPLVKVEEISQTIDSKNFTVQNSVLFAGPFTTTSISTNAKFEARSPKSVQIKFEEGIIRTPQLTDNIVVPENVEFLGQKIDLTPFKGLFTSVQDTALNVAKSISSQPPLKFSIPNSNAESWLLTTYLDEDLRISRVDGGSVFVLIKEAFIFIVGAATPATYRSSHHHDGCTSTTPTLASSTSSLNSGTVMPSMNKSSYIRLDSAIDATDRRHLYHHDRCLQSSFMLSAVMYLHLFHFVKARNRD